MSDQFEVGQRVRVFRHWEFADGISGTISQPIPSIVELAEPGQWLGHVGTTKTIKGAIVVYYVAFDEPADDGSGDGPYLGAVIEAECLEPI
jgi:hypothetical protein